MNARKKKIACISVVGCAVLILALYNLQEAPARSRAVHREHAEETGASGTTPDPSGAEEGDRGSEDAPAAPLWAVVHVADAEGRSIPDAQVRLNCLGTQLIEPQSEPTGDDGIARMRVPREDEYRLVVSAAERAAKVVFARFPGRANVRLDSGAKLTILIPGSTPADWRGRHVWVQSRSGIVHPVSIDAAECDGGSWGPGVLSVFLRGTRNRELARIAMPATGEVRVPVRIPEKKVGVLVRVVDAAGTPRDDWTVRYVLQPIAPLEEWTSALREGTPESGVFRITVPSAHLLLAVDARGAGRSFVYLLPSDVDGDVVEVKVEPSANVEVTCDAGKPVRVLRASYLRPHDPKSLPGNRRVRFIQRTVLGGSGQPVLNLPSARSRYPRTAVLAELSEPRGNPLSLSGLPARSVVWVELEDQSGGRAAAAVLTGEPGSTTSMDLTWGESRNLDVLVRTPDGHPVPGVVVRVDEEVRGSPRAQMTGVTDAGGSIRLLGLDANATCTLTVTDERTTRRFRIPPHVIRGNDPRWSCVFASGKERTVTARVTHADGRPAVGCLVSFAIVNGSTLSSLASEDGTAVARVPEGQRVFAIVSRPTDSNPTVQKEIGPEGVVELTIPADEAGAAASLEMLREAGVVTVNAWRGERIVAKRTVFVDGRGIVFFRRLEPGDYRIEAVVGDASSDAEVTVEPGSQAQVNLRVGAP